MQVETKRCALFVGTDVKIIRLGTYDKTTFKIREDMQLKSFVEKWFICIKKHTQNNTF